MATKTINKHVTAGSQQIQQHRSKY